MCFHNFHYIRKIISLYERFQLLVFLIYQCYKNNIKLFLIFVSKGYGRKKMYIASQGNILYFYIFNSETFLQNVLFCEQFDKFSRISRISAVALKLITLLLCKFILISLTFVFVSNTTKFIYKGRE